MEELLSKNEYFSKVIIGLKNECKRTLGFIN